MTTRAQIRYHQRKFLDQAKARKAPIQISIMGFDITIDPGVFPPATDTKLLASHVNCIPGDFVIDVTTGSGIIPIIAGKQGANGYAVDINSHAVENAKKNINKFKVDFQVIQSDLFSIVPKSRFDFIFANGPFFEGDIKDPLDYACYGAKDFIEELFRNTTTRLKENGKLILVLSEWSDLNHVIKTAELNSLHVDFKDSMKSSDSQRNYLLIEVFPQHNA